MFSERSLSDPVAAVREAHAPDAVVLDAAVNFESLPPEQAEDLALLVDDLDPFVAPDEWLPPDAPETLSQYAGPGFVVGLPGDGSVAWTRQTEPPVIVCKPRLADSPDAFADFLVAEALVAAGLGDPETFLPFFADRYPDVAAATRDRLDPAGTYQVAVACHDAYLGLATRDVFAGWTGPLFDAWLDAGDRLEPRLSELPDAVARGRTTFPDATELACSGVKHALELPAPFDALDAAVYREHGADYALEWIDRVAGTVL